jgi:hypothetical protein
MTQKSPQPPQPILGFGTWINQGNPRGFQEQTLVFPPSHGIGNQSNQPNQVQKKNNGSGPGLKSRVSPKKRRFRLGRPRGGWILTSGLNGFLGFARGGTQGIGGHGQK